MEYCEVLKPKATDLDYCNWLLKRGEKDTEEKENALTFTAVFPDGIEVDIKLINCEQPFIDAVIFDSGNEIYCLEPYFEHIEGSYEFETGGNYYHVMISR